MKRFVGQKLHVRFISFGVEHHVCVGRHPRFRSVVFTAQKPRGISSRHDIPKQYLRVSVHDRRGADMQRAIAVTRQPARRIEERHEDDPTITTQGADMYNHSSPNMIHMPTRDPVGSHHKHPVFGIRE